MKSRKSLAIHPGDNWLTNWGREWSRRTRCKRSQRTWCNFYKQMVNLGAGVRFLNLSGSRNHWRKPFNLFVTSFLTICLLVTPATTDHVQLLIILPGGPSLLSLEIFSSPGHTASSPPPALVAIGCERQEGIWLDTVQSVVVRWLVRYLVTFWRLWLVAVRSCHDRLAVDVSCEFGFKCLSLNTGTNKG